MIAMAPPTEVVIPYRPRKWAKPAHATFRRWLALILHRRAGKTTFELNHHQRAAMDDEWERQRLRFLLPKAPLEQIETLLRKRIYWHVMPSYKQAKLVAWEILKDIARPIPGHKFNESELLVVYPNGNRIQLIGADNPDSLRGPGLSGLSLDEFSQIPGNVFGEILSKALADHIGYCIWSGTIKGHDQLYRLHQAAKDNPEWFALWQDVDVSLEQEDGATITALVRAMEDDRKLVRDGVMTQDEFDQEWYLSPDAAIQGAWYRKEMAAAKQQGRITRVPIEPLLPVDTDWDLGMDDSTAIVFSQSLRSGEVRIVDFYEASGEGFAHYIQILSAKGYTYGKHYPPHDIAVRELGTGKSRKETAKGLGLTFEEPLPALALSDGINATRLFLAKCWFDETRTDKLLEALRNYRKSHNARLNEFTGTPVHNWACVTEDTNVLTHSGTYQIQYLPESGEVLTECGWKPYENPRITRRAAPLVAVTFDDGLTVRCTPEHRFLTASGWRFASDLQTGSLIRSSLIPSRSTSMARSIVFGRRSGISRRAESSSIAMCGLRRLGRSLMDAISIIETEIQKTTLWKTWNASLRLSTCPASGTSVITRDFLQPLALEPRRGTLQMLAVSGTDAMPSAVRVGRNGNVSPNLVSTVVRRCTHWFGSLDTLKSTARTPVKPLRIASVVPLSARADVWCLTVPDGHQWSLENGAITHNSHGADAMRGLAVRYQPPEAERLPFMSEPQNQPGPQDWMVA